MAIRWGRVFFILFILALAGNSLWFVQNPVSFGGIFDSFAGQAVLFVLLFIGLPLGFLTSIVWLISRMIRWFRRE